MGHTSEEIWEYTPRQMGGWLFAGQRRQKRRLAEQLTLSALAASGDARAIREQLAKLERD